MKFVSLILVLLINACAQAEERYVIDHQGMHASIGFRIKHLGYSWLTGRFNDFSGSFVHDAANAGVNAVELTIQTGSIDSNHAERDTHLRSKDFLDVEEFPTATFRSTGVELDGKSMRIHGELQLRGVTREVLIDAREIGAGPDPWGGFRRGFEGSAMLTLRDFGINYELGPSATEVEMLLYVEGVRQ